MADFTGKTYQILKEQILIAKFYKFFQKIEKEVILSNFFFMGTVLPWFQNQTDHTGKEKQMLIRH